MRCPTLGLALLLAASCARVEEATQPTRIRADAVGTAARVERVKDPAEHTRIHANAIGTDFVIIGPLGMPIGQEVTIQGRTKGPRGRPNFVVETVDGKKLAPVTTLLIREIDSWPDGTFATLVGSEKGGIEFTDVNRTNFDGPNDPRFKVQQEVYTRFIPYRVIEPENLSLDLKKSTGGDE